MTKAEAACIRPLCERLGIPTEVRAGAWEPWFGWNGKALDLGHRNSLADAIHEIAHWLVAAPERRHLADFGLGGALRLKESTRRWGYGYPDEEESAASILGILIERHLGLPWQETWEEHNWSECGVFGVRNNVRMLQSEGLLRGLTPTCFLTTEVHQ